MSNEVALKVTKEPAFHRRVLFEILALTANALEQAEAGDDMPTVADISKMCYPFLGELVENMDVIESNIGHITEGSGDFSIIRFSENLLEMSADDLRTWQNAIASEFLGAV